MAGPAPRLGPIPRPEASARAAAALRRGRAARAGLVLDALREAEALLALERRQNDLLRTRCTWLEGEHHRLELALAAAEGRAPHLAALTYAP
ncbi:MAG TPA: hypothetical protein P5024_11480 [Burkholderiaceae bacterium]|nr:hypothetical protein [Rubrivivax sp.]HRZ02169.1 hypothetical protein [Burkholderiaceae bacterium]HRZ59905.1 hypothetical protein [Rubrivivax sp.]